MIRFHEVGCLCVPSKHYVIYRFFLKEDYVFEYYFDLNVAASLPSLTWDTVYDDLICKIYDKDLSYFLS